MAKAEPTASALAAKTPKEAYQFLVESVKGKTAEEASQFFLDQKIPEFLQTKILKDASDHVPESNVLPFKAPESLPEPAKGPLVNASTGKEIRLSPEEARAAVARQPWNVPRETPKPPTAAEAPKSVQQVPKTPATINDYVKALADHGDTPDQMRKSLIRNFPELAGTTLISADKVLQPALKELGARQYSPNAIQGMKKAMAERAKAQFEKAKRGK